MTRDKLNTATAAWKDAVRALWGDKADFAINWGERGAEGSAIRSAWEAMMQADREYHAQFAVR